MAKIALLIGVSEYGENWSRLNQPVSDAEALADVLGDPEIGGFEARLLPNPTNQEMHEAIEDLFTHESRRKEDLLLLYFSGHGVRDFKQSEDKRLYFATKNTTR